MKEFSDGDVKRLLIVTQKRSNIRHPSYSRRRSSSGSCSSDGADTNPRSLKHEGFDRTHETQSRSKITQEMCSVIEDGLYHYEKNLSGKRVSNVLICLKNIHGYYFLICQRINRICAINFMSVNIVQYTCIYVRYGLNVADFFVVIGWIRCFFVFCDRYAQLAPVATGMSRFIPRKSSSCSRVALRPRQTTLPFVLLLLLLIR